LAIHTSKKFLINYSQVLQMPGLNLNATPSEDDDINMEPEFCTQSAPEEMVEEYRDPMVEDQEAFGGSDEQNGRGPQHHGTTHY
jgi:hypothetical protein